MSRVLVLGGTGFVGPFVVQQLLDAGHEVTLFHRGEHEPPLVAAAEHVHGEFARFPEHLPALVERRPQVVIDVNPGIGKSGHGVLHFVGVAERGVVLTSMDVYRAMLVLWGVEGAGPVQTMPVTESDELRTQPSPDLGPDIQFDNLEVEWAVTERTAEFPVTVLRCPVIYGPGDSQRRLKHYVRRMADRRPAIIFDARLARFRLSRGYVENVAQAVVAAVGSDRAPGRTYNVGEPDPLSEVEWAGEVAATFRWEGQLVVAEPDRLPPALQAALPPQDLYGDTSRIRRELGYTESISRAEGLRRAIEWERSQQQEEAADDYAIEDATLASMHGADLAKAIASDGIVTLRPPGPGDAELLVSGRDEQFFRWIGAGADVPRPVGCVWVDDQLVGWVDYDLDHRWLKPGQVNVGYYLFPQARGKGYASRAVQLLLFHLRRDTDHTVATVLIHPENDRSLALARRLGFDFTGEVDGNLLLTRSIKAP